MAPATPAPVSSPWPIVLGIDPGTRALGYGALALEPGGPRFHTCGVLRPAKQGIALRLAELQIGLEELLRQLRSCTLALEKAFYARNVQATLRIGEARGVVLAAAARAGVEVLELAPAAAKKAVLGHGGASKEQVARMIAMLLDTPLSGVPNDATDALALAFACVRRRIGPVLGAGR